MSTDNIDPIETNDVEESGTGTVARRGAFAAVAAGGAAYDVVDAFQHVVDHVALSGCARGNRNRDDRRH